MSQPPIRHPTSRGKSYRTSPEKQLFWENISKLTWRNTYITWRCELLATCSSAVPPYENYLRIQKDLSCRGVWWRRLQVGFRFWLKLYLQCSEKYKQWPMKIILLPLKMTTVTSSDKIQAFINYFKVAVGRKKNSSFMFALHLYTPSSNHVY